MEETSKREGHESLLSRSISPPRKEAVEKVSPRESFLNGDATY